MSRAARSLERHRGKEAFSFLRGLRPGTLPASLRGEYWTLRGRVEQERGDFHAAYRSYSRAHAAHLTSVDRWSALETALKLGDVCRQREKFEEALRWYRLAEKAGGDAGVRLRLDARCGRAMSLRGLGRYDEALGVFSPLLSEYRRRKDAAGVAYVLWAMGTTERFAGRLTNAKRHLTTAIDRYSREQDTSGLAYAWCALGGTLRMIGQAEPSRRLYAKAHAAFARLNDKFGMAYSACGQSNGLRMQGCLREALPYMEEAERGYTQLRLDGPLGFVRWSRAQLWIQRGELRRAAVDLRGAERAFRRSRDPRGMVYVLLGQGELQRAQGRSGASAYRRALRQARRLKLRLEEAHALARLGHETISIYRRLGVLIPEFSKYRALP